MKPFVLFIIMCARAAFGQTGESTLLRVELATATGTPIAKYALDVAGLKLRNKAVLGLAATWKWTPSEVASLRVTGASELERSADIFQAFATGVAVQDAALNSGDASVITLSIRKFDHAAVGGEYLSTVALYHMPLVLSPNTMRSRFLAEAVFDLRTVRHRPSRKTAPCQRDGT